MNGLVVDEHIIQMYKTRFEILFSWFSLCSTKQCDKQLTGSDNNVSLLQFSWGTFVLVLAIWNLKWRSEATWNMVEWIGPFLLLTTCLFGNWQCRAFTHERRLCLTALYLLVWGEAANLRFMPECLCYIFHNVRTTILIFSPFFPEFDFLYGMTACGVIFLVDLIK